MSSLILYLICFATFKHFVFVGFICIGSYKLYLFLCLSGVHPVVFFLYMIGPLNFVKIFTRSDWRKM